MKKTKTIRIRKTKKSRKTRKMKGGFDLGVTNIFSTINNIKDIAIVVFEKIKEIATSKEKALEYGINLDKFTQELKKDAEARGINYDIFVQKISQDLHR